MTPREIILANISHDDAPRIGFTFGDTDTQKRRNDFLYTWESVADYTQKRWIEGKVEYYDDDWGNLWRRMVDGCGKGEICKPVLEDWSGLENLHQPFWDEARSIENAKARFAEDTDNRFHVLGIGGWIFDNARYLRQLDIYLMDMVLYPEELHRLHAKVAEVYEQRIHIAGKAGADAVMIGEDMGTQTGLLFSPTMWREYFGELYARLFGLAHEYDMKVLMHSCGQNWEILDDLLSAGVDCFQFDQPAVYDMPALAAKLREHKAALWSPTDIQKILPIGDEALTRSGTREMCETFRGGFIGKNYPDLHGIGVKPQWDHWAYDEMCTFADEQMTQR